MELIISPWVFYLIEVLENTQFMVRLLLTLGLLGGAFVVVYLIIDLNSEERIKFIKTKLFRYYLMTVAVCILFLIVTPSKETLYQMLIAQHITPDNLQYFKGEITNLVDYIINQIKTLK